MEELIVSKVKMIGDAEYIKLVAKELEVEDPEDAEELLKANEVSKEKNGQCK